MHVSDFRDLSVVKWTQSGTELWCERLPLPLKVNDNKLGWKMTHLWDVLSTRHHFLYVSRRVALQCVRPSQWDTVGTFSHLMSSNKRLHASLPHKQTSWHPLCQLFLLPARLSATFLLIGVQAVCCNWSAWALKSVKRGLKFAASLDTRCMIHSLVSEITSKTNQREMMADHWSRFNRDTTLETGADLYLCLRWWKTVVFFRGCHTFSSAPDALDRCAHTQACRMEKCKKKKKVQQSQEIQGTCGATS